MKAFAVILTVCIGIVPCADAAPANLVSVKLVADREQISPGEVFRIGTLFQIPPRAHIYWANPGDSGLATGVEWSVPSGFETGPLKWPIPVAFRDDFLDETSFGYARETLLFSDVRVPGQLRPGDSAAIWAEVAWLVCLDDGTCIPETASLELTLPVGDIGEPSAHAPVFEKYAGLVPQDPAAIDVPAKIRISETPAPRVRVNLGSPWELDTDGEPAALFPDRGGPWMRAADSPEDAGGRTIAFEAPPGFDGNPGGAVSLPVRNVETGERRTLYLRIERTLRRE